MDSTTSDLLQFAESFFVSLGSQVSTDGTNLLITKIPADFERAYGKPGPYKISFNTSTSEELLSKEVSCLKQ